MTPQLAVKLWVWQRVTAAFLGIFVVVHLATIMYAIEGGLSAAEILGRTQGNVAWLIFYSSFVLASAVHASIGMRNVLGEMLGWAGRALDWSMLIFAIALIVLGARATWGVYA